ncbi:MAG: SAM-dependent methyltransferase [Candidatus Omnitrophota bacterium]|jgi:SAM-dependent methyltransferase
MSNDAGSYDFKDIREREAELARLNRQAQISVELEKKCWKELGLKQDANVVDFASGSGLVTLELAKFASLGSVTGVELSKELLAEANENKSKAGIGNVDFINGNIYDLNLEENKYDFAYSRFLFQHLDDPQLAINNVIKVLKPGGMFCIVDVDDAWLSLSPLEEEFNKFTQLAAKGQNKNGGDRFVGHKLGNMMQEAGFKEVDTQVEVVTSKQIGLNNFLDITTGFKIKQIQSECLEEGTDLLTKIYTATSLPYAWGGVGVFVVAGIK